MRCTFSARGWDALVTQVAPFLDIVPDDLHGPPNPGMMGGFATLQQPRPALKQVGPAWTSCVLEHNVCCSHVVTGQSVSAGVCG
jgi:hypothetical protein